MHIPLHNGWTLRAVGGPVPQELQERVIPATVPGCVHTDLLAAGLISDPHLDDNEQLLQWIGRTDWRYETCFAWDPAIAGAQVELVCEGLDTVAAIEINGVPLAETRNMHRTYRFSIHEHLRRGENILSVTFASAVRSADAMSVQLGARPHAVHHPYNAIRKMACNFGWDWGPDLVTAGMWRPIGLHSWSIARFAAVRPLATVENGLGRVAIHVDVQRDADVQTPLTVRGRVGDIELWGALDPEITSTVVEIQVPEPRLWWPHGHGDQPLYDVRLELATGDSSLEQWQGRIGFRSVRLDIEPDEHGTSFSLAINDRATFVRGANWIPDDSFVSRVTRDRYLARVTQAKEAGINLLRVWGGGIYEADEFFEICDELGILVWQDFLFACAAYAEEEPLRMEVVAEARDNITRLASHPSLAVWNGNNENIWGYEDGGWKDRLDGRTWGWGYYHDVLPAIVRELDSTRPYSPGSPWSPGTEWHPNDPRHGTSHLWDVWNERDYSAYREHVPRFAAEFGWQGPPTWATLTRSISDDPLTPESPGMQAHQKAEYGNQKLEAGLVPHFRVPSSMQDWHWAMSLNQARAVRLGVEHLRSYTPRCMGTIVWQLNDCWPVTSWALVDGDGRRKPAFFALRQAYADRLLTVQPRNGHLVVVAVNDSDDAWSDNLAVGRRSFDGQVIAATEVDLSVPARESVTFPVPAELESPGDERSELIVAETGSSRAFWFFREDRESSLPVPAFEARCRSFEGGYEIHVTAGSLLRDIAILADKVAADAQVDEMLVTLLPEESIVFSINTAAQIDPARFADPSVLRSANQLVGR